MAMIQQTDPVLVTGGTGKQGGATARALLAKGVPVRALVRNVHADSAVALAAQGASLVLGDLSDPKSLQAASYGVRAVFSVQFPNTGDWDVEKRQGKNLVDAAAANHVPQFVQTSVSGAGAYYQRSPCRDANRWNEDYWVSKAYVMEAVKDAGFSFWTIIKPGFFMENLPYLVINGRLMTAYRGDIKLPVVAVRDIGSAAAAAIVNPEKFNKVELELASELLTTAEIATILSNAWGQTIEAPAMSPAEAIALGISTGVVNGQEWHNVVGMPATPDQARSLGLPLTALKTWAVAHRPAPDDSACLPLRSS